MKKIAAFIITCLILTATVIAQGKPGDKAPPVTLKNLNGKTVSLSQYKGKVVLLNFWATWCPPCRAEIPELIKWQREYRNQGLQIIGITYPPTRTVSVRNFARRMKINYPVLFGSSKTKTLFDPGKILPITVVIDKEGNIKEVIEGILYPEEFNQKIKQLLDP